MSEPHFAPSQTYNNLIFISGQLAFGADGHIRGDIEEQTVTCLSHLHGILARNGLTPQDVLKVNAWLRAPEYFLAFDSTYASFFGDHKPARSTVVADLIPFDALVEIEAIAGR